MLARGELEIRQHDEPDPEAHRDAALAAFGLLPPERSQAEQERTFELWPEHVPALHLWFAVRTQWRHNDGMPTGLDYAGVDAVLRIRPGTPRSRRLHFADLQVMERAALEAWGELRALRR